MMKTLTLLLALVVFVKAAPQQVHGAAAGGAGGTFGVGLFKTFDTHAWQPPEVVSEKVIPVEAPPPPPPAPAKKVVVEKTIIPQYVEKRVRVPTYIERTIRVPTYVEKTVRVPAAPHVIEKEISNEEVPAPPQPITTEKHPTYHGYGGSGYGGYGTGWNFAATGNTRGLFTSIFNIPIQTLRAVNTLLNGISGGVSVSASKGVGYY